MAVAQQSPQILLLLRRQPYLWIAVFHQQFQNQPRIASVMFLFPGLGRSNVGRMTDLAVDSRSDVSKDFQKTREHYQCQAAPHYWTAYFSICSARFSTARRCASPTTWRYILSVIMASESPEAESLVVAQGDDGIDPGRAASGQKSGQRGH
jgi:hypothetical protein